MQELSIIFGISYLIGSLPSANIVCALLNLTNPLTAGSKNPGATNVARLHGAPVGALVLMLDVGKGALAVWLAIEYGEVASITGNWVGWFAGCALIGVNLGHAYSIFLHFSGGKCVASGLGALLVSTPILGIVTIVIWIVVFTVSRISGLSAIVAYAGLIPSAILAPIWLENAELAEILSDPPYLIGPVFLTVLVLWRHRGNMRSLPSEWRNT